MSPQNLQTNKPNNLIRRKSPCSLLWRPEVRKYAASGAEEGSWASQGDAAAPSHHSKVSVEEVKGAGQ